MAILAFQKPEKVIMLESTSSFGKFEFRPLEPGFGMTVGNALRRILLSSLEGYAITTVKVAGVDHEFAAIPGVMEDMLKIILNLKQVRFIRTVDNQDAEKVSINVAGVTELTAGTGSTSAAPCTGTRSTAISAALAAVSSSGYPRARERSRSPVRTAAITLSNGVKRCTDTFGHTSRNCGFGNMTFTMAVTADFVRHCIGGTVQRHAGR